MPRTPEQDIKFLERSLMVIRTLAFQLRDLPFRAPEMKMQEALAAYAMGAFEILNEYMSEEEDSE